MKLKSLTLAILMGVGIASSLFVGKSVSATVSCPEGSVRPSAPSIALCAVPDDGDESDLQTTAQKVINIILGIIAFVAVAVIIYGAVVLVMSQGDSAKVARARNAMIFSLVGLIISLFAFAIVNFVLNDVLSGKSSAPDTSQQTTPTK